MKMEKLQCLLIKTQKGQGLVKINKDVYNTKLPRSIIQLIIARFDIHGEK